MYVVEGKIYKIGEYISEWRIIKNFKSKNEALKYKKKLDLKYNKPFSFSPPQTFRIRKLK